MDLPPLSRPPHISFTSSPLLSSMRIHLPLHPSQFKFPTPGVQDSPLVKIGGDLVLIELQGELNHEGDKDGGVVGILGLDRPDKPTLHLGEHHLLHGKITSLQKPYAVIRKATGPTHMDPTTMTTELEGDASEQNLHSSPKSVKRKFDSVVTEEEEEEEGPLFGREPLSHKLYPDTPGSPPERNMGDYSSELDIASPPIWTDDEDVGDDDGVEGGVEGDDDGGRKERKRPKMTDREVKPTSRRQEPVKEPTRTRHYEVVGIVRKKVVFNLRPEPIVTATVLPE